MTIRVPKRLSRPALMLTAVSLGCLAASEAAAQNAAQTSAPGIADIIVSANKRSESIQKVPIAITAVTSDRLEQVGITSTKDLAQVVPGLVIQTSLSGTQAHLRGVGTTALSAGTENSVATYVDGVYILSLNGALAQLNSIDQIEVLKGPQGTLFGRNATGGVISIRTKDPSHEFGGNFNLRYGNYDTVSGQAYLTAGITDDVAADIAGFVSIQGDGWGKNLFNGKDVNKLDQYAVRSKWLIEPTDKDTFRLIGDYSEIRGNYLNSFAPFTAVNYGPGTTTAAERAAAGGPDGQTFQTAVATWLATGGAAGLAPFAVVGDPYTFTGGFYDIAMAQQPRYLFKTGGGSLQWDHEFDAVRFTSITAYRRAFNSVAWSNVPVPADRASASWREKESQFSQELQLASGAGSAVKWVLGLYYLNGKAEYTDFSIVGTTLVPLQSLGFQSKVTTESGAAFGQVTVPVWAGANITGGLRYTIERRGVDGVTLLTLPPAAGGVVIPVGATDAHTTFKKLTWRVALDQQLAPGILAYASYNRGFKSGLYNSIPPSAEVIQPEVLDAFEAGLKTDLFDRQVRLNVAGFYYDYKNLQVTVFTPTSAVLQNGAKARIYGADVDLTVKLGTHLTLTAGGTLMKSEFLSYPNAGFFTPQPASAGGGTVSTIGSAKGNRLPYAPDFTFNVGAAYTTPVGDGTLNANVNYSYSGRWYAGPDNIASQPAYGLLDGSINYTFPGDHLQAGVWVRNLTDKKYRVFIAEQGNPGGYFQGLVGAPRTYGVSLGYKF
ncbi:MAG TPA: TonB-dependent receptor [Novosphingobium sp.]|nr:TonB-dependent receptor [Novosphingobium sp.]